MLPVRFVRRAEGHHVECGMAAEAVEEEVLDEWLMDEWLRVLLQLVA